MIELEDILFPEGLNNETVKRMNQEVLLYRFRDKINALNAAVRELQEEMRRWDSVKMVKPPKSYTVADLRDKAKEWAVGLAPGYWQTVDHDFLDWLERQ